MENEIKVVPFTLKTYREAWDRAHFEDPEIPLNVDIELASVCNLKCPFCFWGSDKFNADMQKLSFDNKPKKRFMETELAINIINEAAELKVPALKFNWRGESTLHPDFSYILQDARRQRDTDNSFFHEIILNTNGNFPDSAIEGIMATTKVIFSIDSFLRETYQRMRRGGSLDLAIDNVKKIISRGHENIVVRRVMTEDNASEEFALEATAIFGKNVSVSEHYCFNRNEVESLDMERTYCGYPSQRLVIASDGTVYPCCVDFENQMMIGYYGAVELYGDIKSIWQNPNLKNLRRELKKDIFNSEICADCKSFMAYKSPKRDNVSQ